MWIKQSQKGKFSYIVTIYSFSAVFDKRTVFDANSYKRSHVISLVNICVGYRMFVWNEWFVNVHKMYIPIVTGTVYLYVGNNIARLNHCDTVYGWCL